MTTLPHRFAIRRAVDSDRDDILGLMKASLGWNEDSFFASYFAWKHLQSPFGKSPAWVCIHEEAVVGFRTFMRWEFTLDGATLRAVRAVDTATHPEYRGRGIFSRLTNTAIEELTDEGVDLIFNTPNDQSLPGYLKLGWEIVGQLPVAFRVRTPAALARIARSRVAAGRESLSTSAGALAASVFADREGVQQLLHSLPRVEGLSTLQTPSYLAWRYGFEHLPYRVISLGADITDGLLVFRVRQRGPSKELVVSEVLVPARHDAARSLRLALKGTRADYALSLRNTPARVKGLMPMPRMGPVLTKKKLSGAALPGLSDWRLSMGDVELF